MKLRLFWFLLGAGLASGIAALLVSQLGDRVPAPGATGSALDDRLASIDRRLAAIEKRGVSPVGTATVASSTAAPPAADAAPERTPAQQHASSAASAIVEQSIAAGTWTRESSREFAAVAADLPGRERFDLMRRLAAAINDDRVKPEPGATTF
jgi:hypothetical protein